MIYVLCLIKYYCLSKMLYVLNKGVSINREVYRKKIMSDIYQRAFYKYLDTAYYPAHSHVSSACSCILLCALLEGIRSRIGRYTSTDESVLYSEKAQH